MSRQLPRQRLGNRDAAALDDKQRQMPQRRVNAVHLPCSKAFTRIETQPSQTVTQERQVNLFARLTLIEHR